jgi:hypothetical protein
MRTFMADLPDFFWQAKLIHFLNGNSRDDPELNRSMRFSACLELEIQDLLLDFAIV